MRLLAIAFALVVHGAAPAAGAQQDLKQHPARQVSTWSDWIRKPAAHRIAPAPPVLVDYLRKDNEQQGWPDRPDSGDIPPDFVADTAAAIQGMPPAVRRHFEKHVAGVFLVRQLGGTAYGEMLNDYARHGRGVIVLDVGSLEKKANEWATWRESSPFADSETAQIEAVIERDADDNRVQAIQFILLHEIAHLVGAATGQHPDWNGNIRPGDYPYSRLSWRLDKDKLASRREEAFPSRGQIAYYKFKAAPLKSADIESVYRQFLQTDFVSLYSSTNMFDDFAETYAQYVHVVLQHKPWSLVVRSQGKEPLRVDRPILDPRCATKRKFFDAFFGREKNK